jgi:hypothetical protein
MTHRRFIFTSQPFIDILALCIALGSVQRVRRSRLFGFTLIAAIPVCVLLAAGFSLNRPAAIALNRVATIFHVKLQSNFIASSTATTLTLFILKQTFKWFFRPSETSSLSAKYDFSSALGSGKMRIIHLL